MRFKQTGHFICSSMSAHGMATVPTFSCTACGSRCASYFVSRGSTISHQAEREGRECKVCLLFVVSFSFCLLLFLLLLRGSAHFPFLEISTFGGGGKETRRRSKEEWLLEFMGCWHWLCLWAQWHWLYKGCCGTGRCLLPLSWLGSLCIWTFTIFFEPFASFSSLPCFLRRKKVGDLTSPLHVLVLCSLCVCVCLLAVLCKSVSHHIIRTCVCMRVRACVDLFETVTIPSRLWLNDLDWNVCCLLFELLVCQAKACSLVVLVCFAYPQHTHSHWCLFCCFCLWIQLHMNNARVSLVQKKREREVEVERERACRWSLSFAHTVPINSFCRLPFVVCCCVCVCNFFGLLFGSFSIHDRATLHATTCGRKTACLMR